MRSTAHRSRSTWLLAAALFAAGATAAHAQCTGDCGGDREVTVEEIITMVNIANDAADLSACPAADGNGDGDVAIDDIISAVNNANNGCPAVVTPTPTPTPTQGGVTPMPTPTVPALCGNGVVNFDIGETCDDGNTVDGKLPGDICPSNCRVRACTPDGTTLDVNVSFTPPGGAEVNGITVFLRYQEDRVLIPGSGNNPAVLNRITNTPENAVFNANDVDFYLGVSFNAFDLVPFAPGPLFTVTFGNCSGATPPTAADFLCRVEDASFQPDREVPGVTCSVSIP